MQKKKLVSPGSRLPSAPVALGKVPIGAAVKIEGRWWIATFRINADGPINLRPITDPNDPDWHRGSVKGERLFSPVHVANDLSWPVRTHSKARDVIDPVARRSVGSAKKG